MQEFWGLLPLPGAPGLLFDAGANCGKPLSVWLKGLTPDELWL